MTVHRISSVVNKQALYETLAIFCTRFLFIFIYFIFFFTSRNEHSVIKAMAKRTVSPYRFPKATRHSEMPCVLLCFSTLLSGKNMSCNFPGGSLGQCLSVKGHHGAASDSFLSISFFFFSYCNHSALLLHWFPSCSSSAVSEAECRKSVAEQLRNKQPIMASMRKPWIHLSL